jgi:hypothetical protein
MKKEKKLEKKIKIEFFKNHEQRKEKGQED